MSSSEGEEDVVVKLSKLKVNRGYNKDPNDKEDIAEVEGKLYAILSVLDREIASRNYQVSQTSPPPLPTKRLVNLPTLEIPNFTGKYSEYIPFKELFTSVIHNDATLDNIQKLHYLRSFLCSEPLKLIQNLPLSSASYSEAIKMLDDRYNQKFQVISEHINILLDLPHISRSTSIQLREFISQTKQNLAAIKNMKICIDSWDPILICILLRKLDSYTGRAYHMERDPSAEPTVMQLLSFLEKRALALENAEPSPKPSTSGGYGTKQSKFAVNVTAVESKTTCNYCKSTEHKIFSCQKFKILPSVDRFKFIKDQKLCDTCLNKHMGKCRFHFRCDQCKKNHNTLIHLDKMAEPVIMFSSKQTNDILLPTARIKLFTQDNREVHIKAVLDSASQASLVTSKVVSFLGLAPVQNKTNIIGVTDNKSSVKFSVPLEIHSIKTPYSTSINCHVVDTITCRLPQNRIDTSTIEIPAGIELADDEYYLPSDINMLIGADVFFQILEPLSPSPETEQTSSCALQPSPVASPELSARTPAADGPRILNTKFGYIIGGALPSQHESGGRVLFATDDFFAPCEGLIRDQEPVFDAERYTEFGKWMDGWETRRKRIPGHDWCLLALPTLCLVRGLLVDTAFFTGNYAPKFSVQAARLTPKEAELIPKRAGGIGQACSQQDLQQVSRIKSDKWQEIVPRTALRPGYEETRENYLKVVNETPWTHLRVNLFPDGGIARLRVFGEARPELPPADQLIDLASLLNGATCLGFSNAHYGNPKNMIKPSKSLTMADGWETARRLDRPEIIEVNEDGTLQVPGEEWAVFKLGFPGAVSRVCVDTAHFKGNFPDSVKIEGAFLAEKWDVDDNIAWSTIMKSKLSADKEHWFDCKSENITHIRVTMAPDGGISRVRVFGYVKSE